MKMRFVLSLITFVIITLSAKSQLTLDGQFRVRGEYRDGYKELASEASYGTPLVSQRSRLVLNFADTTFTFRVSAQDARVWGQNWNGMPNNTIHVHEAWALYKANNRISVKLGRQEFKYDDQRILAAKNFSLTGATYDAALLMYNNKELGVNLHWGTMINNMGQTNFLAQYSFPLSFKYMSFLWFDMAVSDAFKFNTINLFDLTQNPANAHIMYGRNTLGANGIFNLSSNSGARIGAYYQFGQSWVDNGALGQTNRKLSAYSYNASLWTDATDALKLTATVDIYSGHDWSSNDEHYAAFSRLLGAGHGHLGFIDYFTSPDLKEVRWAGVNDYFLRADLKLNAKLSLQATYHYFMLNKPNLPNLLPPGGYSEVDPGLGSEVDFVGNYKFNPNFSIQAAFMVMLPSPTMEIIKLAGTESELSYFGYLSILFTPKFFEKD